MKVFSRGKICLQVGKWDCLIPDPFSIPVSPNGGNIPQESWLQEDIFGSLKLQNTVLDKGEKKLYHLRNLFLTDMRHMMLKG